MIYPEIPLPRLLNSDDLTKTDRFIRPISVDINQKIVPLSYASMTLPQDESVPGRSYVELFTSTGSAGIYRVTSPQDAFGEDVISCELEHAITEVGDWVYEGELSEMIPAKDAIGRIFNSHYAGNKWQLGSTTALGSTSVAVEISYRNVLEGILGVLDQVPTCMMTFDFSTTPWTFGFAKKGTTVQAEGRLSRNVTSAKITYDDSSLCTRAFYQYTQYNSDGSSETKWAHKDADASSKTKYGIVERPVSTGSGYTKDEAEYVVNRYLAKHKKPLTSISIEAIELSIITGESLDRFEIGRKFRLALPDYGIDPVEDVITEIAWKGLYSGFEQVTVNLGDQEDGVVNFLHDVDSSGGSSSGGRAGSARSQQNNDFWTAINRTDYAIKLEAYERVKQDDFNYSYINITACYIRQEVGQTANDLASRIDHNADTISLLVGFQSVNSSQIHSFAHKSDFPDPSRGVKGDIYYDRSEKKYYKLYNGRYIEVKLTDNGDGTFYVGAGGITTHIDDQGRVSTNIDADKVIIGRLDNKDLDSWAKDAKDGTGVFAKFLTVKKLTAQEIETMLANINEATINGLYVEGQAIITDTLFVQWGVKVNNNGGNTYSQLNLADASVDGNTLKIWKVGDASNAPSINFSKAATLSVEYGGDNKGDTATYTVTGTPAGNFPGGNTATGTFKINDASKNVATITDPNSTVRARLAHNRYNGGWAAAYAKVKLPTTNTSASFVVKTPPSTVDGAATETTYTLSEATSSIVQVKSNSGTIVARLTHGGSASVPASAIHVDPIGWYGTEPSTDAEASTIGSYVQGHSSGWVRFDVYLDGYGSPRKSYRFKIG